MKTINDIDGIDKTRNDQGGQQKSGEGQGQKNIDDVDIGALDPELKNHINNSR